MKNKGLLFFDEIKKGLSSNIADIIDAFTELLIWLITGIPYFVDAIALDVPAHPAIYAYLLASIEESIPLARLAPNSITGIFWAELVILLEAVVTKEAWLKQANRDVSNNWAVIASALTVIIGSLGKTMVPSSTA